MNILAIGNSFSEDATRYLYDIARADAEALTVVNLYIGGCSLDRHYRNMLSGNKAYELQYNGNRTGFFVSLEEALLSREWDVVTLQQASHRSFDVDSYEPYIGELAAYVRRCVPKVKIYVHQTWAYEAGSDRLLRVAGYETPEAMLRDVVSAYQNAANTINADGIIKSGELFEKLLDSGIERIHRDTFHASLAHGRYALALLWYATICKKSVADNRFCDQPTTYMPPKEIDTIKKCVDDLLKQGVLYENY